MTSQWQPYGDARMIHGTTGAEIFLLRRGQKCRWIDVDGTIVSEQSNVAPALAWAVCNGYFDPAMVAAGIFSRAREVSPGKWIEETL